MAAAHALGAALIAHPCLLHSLLRAVPSRPGLWLFHRWPIAPVADINKMKAMLTSARGTLRGLLAAWLHLLRQRAAAGGRVEPSDKSAPAAACWQVWASMAAA